MIAIARARAARCTLLALLVSSAPVAAQSVAFSGYTTGCFDSPCTAALTTDAFQTATLNGITYENATFSGTTVGGSAMLNAGANALGVRDVNNLGAFYLTSQVAEYGGRSFFLSVHFDVPGLGTIGIPATLSGFVRLGSEISGVGIDFDNGPRLLPFTLDGVSSTLSLTVDDAFVDAPLGTRVLAVPVTGRITVAAVPEPATWSLLALGLVIGWLAPRASCSWRGARDGLTDRVAPHRGAS